MPSICILCSEEAKLRCSGCRAPYCSEKHQKLFWKFHKLVCGRPYPEFVLPSLQRFEIDIWAKNKMLPDEEEDELDRLALGTLLGAELLELGQQTSRSIEEIVNEFYPSEDAFEALWNHVQEQLKQAPSYQFLCINMVRSFVIKNITKASMPKNFVPVYEAAGLNLSLVFTLLRNETQEVMMEYTEAMFKNMFQVETMVLDIMNSDVELTSSQFDNLDSLAHQCKRQSLSETEAASRRISVFNPRAKRIASIPPNATRNLL